MMKRFPAISFTVLISCLAAATPSDAQPATEVRGTWLTTTGPDHIRSGLNSEFVVNSLRNTGVNTVYVEAWKNGFTNFRSQVMDDLIGVDRSPFLGSRDLLEETTAVAHRKGMIHIAWFEYGFSSQFKGSSPAGVPDNPLTAVARSRGWLLEDQAGQVANSSNGFAWMNPAVPEVRQLLVDLTLEAIRTHDLDGIQFDDRLAWPKQFGWDATTAAIYKAQTGRDLPSNVNDADFRRWRQGKVAEFAAQLYRAVKAERPDLLVSVSPSVAGFSDEQFNADWRQWLADGLFDEYVPQVYRANLSDYRRDLPDNVQPFIDNNAEEKAVIGIRFNGAGADTPAPTVQQMIVDAALAADGDLAGHSLFYSKGLIDNAAAMSGFYGGPSGHPYFDEDWRPEAWVASRVNAQDDLWAVQLPEAGYYRLIAKRGFRWTEESSRLLEAGFQWLAVPDADAVELIVDRRPIPEPTSVLMLAVGSVLFKRPT